ncbi:MAG: glycosyltransferase family 2 protein [Casimicrobiaceae bacterium]
MSSSLASSDDPARPLLSVVMPAYNEADNIAAAIADIREHVFGVVARSELVVIDDGSRDETAAIVRELAAADPRIRLLTQANAGHGPALVRGLREARADRCLLLDSDRQIGLQDFGHTWKLADGHDAVLGVRWKRCDPWHRLLLTKLLRAWLSALVGVHARDANVPYKLVRRDIAMRALAMMPAKPAIPSVLLTVFLHLREYRIAEQPVEHFARTAGQPSLRLARLTVFCRGALQELMQFHKALNSRS